jgi:hypothetical protein
LGSPRELSALEARREGWRTWALAAALALPFFAPLLGHYIEYWRAGLTPTGFVIYDAASYLANAKEHFDNGGFSATYGNPYSYDYSTPRIYFQPLTLILAVLLRVTRGDPGLVFAAVGIVAAIVCCRTAIALFDRFDDHRRPGGALSLLAFVWGGGAFVLVASILSLVPSDTSAIGLSFDTAHWWRFVRAVDPGIGWWFLNFGRNLVLPTEAVYHALFFAAVVSVVARRFAAAAALMGALSISQPFTGSALLLIVATWAAIEIVLLRNDSVPRWFLIVTVTLGVLHGAYYLGYLPTFPEHRQLQTQWTLSWNLKWFQGLIGYAIVATFAAWRLRTRARLREALSHSANRLLVVWLLVTLALENHDLFVENPIQPLHFTRGYSWIALFLLGVPAITACFRRLRDNVRKPLAWTATAAVLAVFFADNTVWLAGAATQKESLELGFALSTDEVATLAWMRDKAPRNAVVLSEDEDLGYLTTVYTPLRPWHGHWANTPWARQRRDEFRRFFKDGRVVDAWRALPMLVVFRASTDWGSRMRAFGDEPTSLVYSNGSYAVVYIGGSRAPSAELSPASAVRR